MREFIILIVYNIIALAACGNIFHGDPKCLGEQNIQEVLDHEVIDNLLESVAEKPENNITVMDDILNIFYKGVKDEEFGIGAGYFFRNGTVSGIIDPVAHRLKKSEWEIKTYTDSRSDNYDYLWRITTEIRHPRLLVTYDDVRSIGLPRALGRLTAEFTGVRCTLEFSRRFGPNTEEYRIDLKVVFAEDSSIRMSGWDLSSFKPSHEFESHLRKELKNALNKTLRNAYNKIISK